MHLFKSQWLQEHGHRAQAPAYSGPTFGPRYGRHPLTQQTRPVFALPRHDSVVIGDFHAEGEILLDIARYDHAA